MRHGAPLFVEANLNPHYWPFRGIVFSILVHASLLTMAVTVPLLIPEEKRFRLEDAVILDADDLKDALFLPMLGSATPPKMAANSEKQKPKAAPPAKEGLSYPGPQPILSEFPVPTNHTQTILQPTLKNPLPLDASLLLPNVVRLPAPRVDPRLKVPEAVTAPVIPPSLAARPDVALTGPERPLAAPLAESRFRVLDESTTARAALQIPATQLQTPLTGPARPLAAPLAESKLKVPDQVNPGARPASPGPVAQLDVPLTGPARPLAAPVAESRFKLSETVTPIARPALPVAAGDTTIAFSGPNRPLAAPVAESKLKVPDTVAPGNQPARTTQAAPLDLPMTSLAGPLAAPIAESRIRVPEATSSQGRPAPGTPASARLDVPVTGPARPLAAPLAESRLKVPDATPAAAVRPTQAAAVPLSVPTNSQPLVALSPTPARRDQPVVVPPGEARGQFAISPQPNLTFPGTEPGARPGNGTSPTGTNTVAGLVNSSNAATGPSTTTANNRATAPGAGAAAGNDAFPGISILSGNEGTGPRISTVTTTTNSVKAPPAPLQTSYGITIIASGGSGGGLPDFGLFENEQVHTVYLDMRRTIEDDPLSWTVEFGVKQAETRAENERVTTVGGQQEVLLPFPITKERPTMPADLVRKYPGRLVIAYAVVTKEGKIEQLSVKQSPDPLLNEAVLSTLRKWTFRPARRNGEVISAKMLIGIPVRTD